MKWALCLRSDSAHSLCGKATEFLTTDVCLSVGIWICVIACWIYLPWEFSSFFISWHTISVSSYLFPFSAPSSDKSEFFKKHREMYYTDCVSYLWLFFEFIIMKRWNLNFFLWLFYSFAFLIFVFCFQSPYWIFDLWKSNLK